MSVKWPQRKPGDSGIPQGQRGMFPLYDEVTISGTAPNRIAEGKNDGTVERTLFEWVTFNLSSNPIPQRPAQRKYEIWVGAYLHFSAPIDFEAFFDWSTDGKNLTIFLYPDPFDEARLVADPPPPPAPPPPETSA